MKKWIVIASLAVLGLSACKGTEGRDASAENEESASMSSAGVSDLAFVNTDRLIMECELYKSEGTLLKNKTEKAQQNWANKERSLQNEAAQLQDKYNRGLITTRDAQAQQEALQKKAETQQINFQKEAQTLDEENFVFTNRMQDLLLRAVQEVNADKQYKMVLNASALLDADMALDISDAVLAKMDELYAAEKNDKKK